MVEGVVTLAVLCGDNITKSLPLDIVDVIIVTEGRTLARLR